MKDQLSELLENMQVQINNKLPVNDSGLEILTLIHTILEEVAQRIQELEIRCETPEDKEDDLPESETEL